MFNINKLFLILVLLFFGCTPTSMEFRSAKSATRAEKDLKRGEEWALKALETETDKDNALVPYFIATEIYKPQERWEEMAEMLDEAMRRNPEQKLEQPKILIPRGDITKENVEKSIAYTIEQGVNAYRQDLWATIYNQAIKMNTNNNDLFIEKLKLCLKVDSSRMEAYASIIAYYASSGDFKKAKEYVDQGINANKSSPVLYEMNAKLLFEEFQNNSDKSTLKEAERMYLKAADLALDNTELLLGIKKQLILVYTDMGENQKAIDMSNELLNIYYDDPDLYFNVGILYQRLATALYDSAVEGYVQLNAEEVLNPEVVVKIYKNFMQAKIYAEQSKEKFLEANDLEIEDTGSREAASDMRKLAKNIKEIYIPSVQEIAESEGINLN